MSSNEQSNTNNLNYNTDVTVFPFNMPTATLATLGIEGATEYTSGKEYHGYIPVLNKEGKLDESFLKGVQVDISLPPTGPYYFVDSVEGNDTNSGSIQNPFKTLKKAFETGNDKDKNPKITSFVLRSRIFDSEEITLDGIPEIYIIGDGYGKSTIKKLKLASRDTTTGHTIYLKDVNVETLTIATAEIIDVYLIGSTSLNVADFEEASSEEGSITDVTPNSTEFNLHTDVNVIVAPGVYEKANRSRIIHSDALQYNGTTTLNEKIASIDKNISDSDTAFKAHEGNEKNPHNVTTAQIGALPLCGGVMQGDVYYNTEDPTTKLTDVSYVNSTIESYIDEHDSDVTAHSDLLSIYATLDDLDNTSACITSDINAHIDNKDNPHELYLVNIPAMQSDTKKSHLWLKDGSLTIYNDIAVPTTLTIVSGGITINSEQVGNFKSTGASTNTVFRRYPYNRVTRDSSYSNLNANRIYYYFTNADLKNLISPETGEYIQLSDDWLRGYIYITLNTKDRITVNGIESPWVANKINIVPHPLDGNDSDLSSITTELEWLADSAEGFVFNGTIKENDYVYGSNPIKLTSKIDEGLVNEGSLVLTSRDIDTTGILNCIGEIKDSIDSVDNKTSSLEGELNELTGQFNKLEDALLCGGEVTIIATETKSIVSENKKATVSISEDNRLEMCVKSTIDGEDLCTLRYFLTDSYDANIVTPLIEMVDTLESKSTEFQGHINNKSNPHQVKASQITEKASTAGKAYVSWDENSNYSHGFVEYDFDPAMYNEGYVTLDFEIPVDRYLGSTDISYCRFRGFGGDFELVDNSIYRSKETYDMNGANAYIFIALNLESIIAEGNAGTPLQISVGLSTDPSESIEVITAKFNGDGNNAPIMYTEYEQSGTYQVLTEAMLRDKLTGKAYTICVENGELKLQEYRATKYEA